MSGQYKYDLVQKAATGVFGVLAFGIWVAKNWDGILKEARDTQPDEAIALLTVCATQELPKLWAAFQAPAEEPLI